MKVDLTMYVRDFESYKSKRNTPLLIWLISQYLIFSILLAIIFTIASPIKITDKITELNKNSIYFVQTNLFFINLELTRGDYIIVNLNKTNTQKIFFSQLIKILSFNLIKTNEVYNIYQILGVPHDIISIKDGALYINNVQKLKNISTIFNKDKTIYLAKDEYYCISTIKNSLDDSSFIGIINQDSIYGKVIKSFNLSIKK
ncbi:MAG: S26 family signal peptidase [Exilispira sp.]|jgi:signal peptidase I|nr:S26 family signal peptidase [Exilispira sp.]